ncbi:bile acid:sodium symporter [Oscillochloris sp. ZM17-4]|uniref:arsenic resistance protein n=1 Tax=Oscillochloris sp. ZM17-4 TaxID=2866714 RepID=UPI001C738782|nr:bile acid:sodium symporter [Oscillochloris sp. ZM17-4]MBX0326918.1 bile acid:sodium symporter [Oscillochloris sp. ZM17-4]
MWKALAFLQKHLVWSIPAAMVLGLLYGSWANPAPLRSLITPLTFLMVYPMMVTLNLRQVFTGGDTRLQLTTQLLNFGVIPFVGFAMGRLLFADRPLIAVGLLLTSLLPTSGMTISWTGFAKGNVLSAVKMTVIGLVIGSIATPVYLKLLMGTAIDVPLSDIFSQIILIVFLPMAAGYATQRGLIKLYGVDRYNVQVKGRFPMISTVGVVGIVFTAIALKATTIISSPALLLRLALPLLLLYALNFLLSTLVGKMLFNRGDAIALVYGSVMRNLSIALAVAMTAFGKDGSEIALIIALAYIIQVQAAAWYVKFTDRIFGSAPEKLPAAQPGRA